MNQTQLQTPQNRGWYDVKTRFSRYIAFWDGKDWKDFNYIVKNGFDEIPKVVKEFKYYEF